MCAVARYQEFKSPNQSFAVTRIHFLPGVLLILSNLATMCNQPHCGSAAANDLKTATNKLEFSDLGESVTQPV